MNTKLRIGTTTVLAAFATMAPVAAQAAPAPTASHTDPYVVGGEPAENAAVVQLKFSDGTDTFGCSGTLIDDDWVLTARHCTEDAVEMNAYVSNSTENPGPAHPAEATYEAPSGDVGLVKLAEPVSGAQTMKMTDSAVPSAGDTATIQGYGLRADRVPSTGLFQADVEVLGSSLDAYFGPAIHVRGINGASNHGDSGGPMIVDGEIVGVCSTGDTMDPGADINAGSNYASIAKNRDWIQRTAGI